MMIYIAVMAAFAAGVLVGFLWFDYSDLAADSRPEGCRPWAVGCNPPPPDSVKPPMPPPAAPGKRPRPNLPQPPPRHPSGYVGSKPTGPVVPPSESAMLKKLMDSLPQPPRGEGGYFAGPEPIERDL